MYKPQQYTQISFENFEQPMGLKMNPNNRWIHKAEQFLGQNLLTISNILSNVDFLTPKIIKYFSADNWVSLFLLFIMRL
ncbi:MAG: hypothetical protein LBF82_00455 [Lactobacillales bacterium]|jgi:hypothetical protein|nr:hypothetical protein [Lactobacillales bacterium]